MSTATVHALSTGSITLPEKFFITPSSPTARRTVPSLSFLIQHHNPTINHTTRLLFDLGIRRDLTLYPTTLTKHLQSREPVTTKPDAVASLAEGNLTPSHIDFIIFSHVHYDHVGLPSDFPSPTRFIVGPGALDLLSGKTNLNIGSHSFFEADLLPRDRTIELPPLPSTPLTSTKPLPPQSEAALDTPLILTWSNTPTNTLPPFPQGSTIDLFGDGTTYIIHAPGHLPGHINLLVRTSPTPSSSETPSFVLLAGDTVHDIRLFNETYDIATWEDEAGKTCCIHYDIPRARDTIRLVKEVSERGVEVEVDVGDNDGQGEGRKKKVRAGVEVVFAHNWEWEEDARRRGRFWPGRL